MSPARNARPKPVMPPPRRRPRPDQLIVRWLLVLLVLAVLALVSFRFVRSGSLPNVDLAGHDVGALDEDELRERVSEIADERESEEVEVSRPGAGDAPAVTRTYPRRALGYEVDVDATMEEILTRGRQGNPLAALYDQVAGSFMTIEMDPIVSFDEGRMQRWVARVEEDLASEATGGGITFKGVKVIAEAPQEGVTVDGDELRARAEEVILDDDEISLAAPVEKLESEMTLEEVRRAERLARELVSGPITLKYAGEQASLGPKEIASVLSARNVGDKIRIEVGIERLSAVVDSSLAELGRDPSDASFQLSGGRVRVIGGQTGFAVDGSELAASLMTIATSDDRTAPAPVKKVRPEFSTADAKELNIDERVSTFTTYHSCCEPRVENIHRIADLLDGTVVKPGESFSINDTVGERTTAKGFVPAPAISNGEYVEEVGGGISQFATTTFNAIFFGGYQFDEYKAHSYYISRYPMGREATVSHPYPDLAFTNDSGSGIYMDTSYTDTSITVTFYGTKERNVRSVSGKPHNYTSPDTQCKVNRSLRGGQSQVIQTGSRGFDITVTRIFGDGTEEDFDTTYLPVPEIVEKRKC